MTTFKIFPFLAMKGNKTLAITLMYRDALVCTCSFSFNGEVNLEIKKATV